MKRVAAQPNVNAQELAAIRLPLPPISEQRRIVDLLNHANSIRRLRREAQEKARQVIPTLFVEMFGDPGENPRGWPVRPLRDVIQGLEGGRNLAPGPDNQTGSPFRILKVSAVTSGYFRPDESKPAPTGYVPPPSHIVRQGDLLFSRANTVDLVGATALVEHTPPNILLPDKIWRVHLNGQSPVTPRFLLALLQNRSVRAAMGKIATGTSDSMRNVSQGRLLAMCIPVPPLELQHAFAERVADVQSIIAQQDRMATASEQMVDALMAKVFQSCM